MLLQITVFTYLVTAWNCSYNCSSVVFVRSRTPVTSECRRAPGRPPARAPAPVSRHRAGGGQGGGRCGRDERGLEGDAPACLPVPPPPTHTPPRPPHLASSIRPIGCGCPWKLRMTDRQMQACRTHLPSLPSIPHPLLLPCTLKTRSSADADNGLDADDAFRRLAVSRVNNYGSLLLRYSMSKNVVTLKSG